MEQENRNFKKPARIDSTKIKESPRIRREKKTLAVLIEIYCKQFKTEGSEAHCENYRKLLDYAIKRTENCPYGKNKPVCNKCRIHCYSREMRERVREVMRYSGPRIMLTHPYLAIMHYVDSMRKYPELKKKKN